MNDQDFYYDLAKFEVEITASRSNFLLVFQSMLLGTVASIADRQTFIPLWVLLLFGLIISIVWFYLNALTYVVSEVAFNSLTGMDDRVRKIVHSRERNWLLKKGSTSFIMSFIFPILTEFVWAILLCYYSHSCVLMVFILILQLPLLYLTVQSYQCAKSG